MPPASSQSPCSASARAGLSVLLMQLPWHSANPDRHRGVSGTAPFSGALLWAGGVGVTPGRSSAVPWVQLDLAEGLRQSCLRWLWQVPPVPPGAVQASLTILCFPLVQSLDWETFEQYCTWQLFLAHSIPLETIIPILQHLKYKGELSPAQERHGAGPRRP